MPSNPYLLSAYAIILLTFAGYSWALKTRLQRLRDELAAPRDDTSAGELNGG